MQHDADDLSNLEHQLAACRPTATGLDADAMLFAAGQASAGQPRFVWPAIAAGFAILSAALGAGLVSERSERMSLAAKLGRPVSVVAEVPTPTAAPPAFPPAPDSYVVIRRAVEREGDAWPIAANAGPPPSSPPAVEPVLHAWSSDLPQ